MQTDGANSLLGVRTLGNGERQDDDGQEDGLPN